MSTRDNGGRAFPFAATDTSNLPMQSQGMTLRDYFAAKALPALFAVSANASALGHHGWQDEIAADAYELADAMLKARQS